MRHAKRDLLCAGIAILGMSWWIAPNADATLIGTVPTTPASTVLPGLVPPGTDPGTLLATLSTPFTTSLGMNSGTIVSAVFREAGGTLDFYYQVTNNATAPNCGVSPPCDSLSRETNTSFTGFETATGFRTDGSTLPGGVFVDGTVAPIAADRNGAGNVIGFTFDPLTKLAAGEVSNILVVSTDATEFAEGHASVIDGGVTTVSAFEPTPEPGVALLLGGGLVALLGGRPRRDGVGLRAAQGVERSSG